LATAILFSRIDKYNSVRFFTVAMAAVNYEICPFGCHRRSERIFWRKDWVRLFS
jgi:hypothetical protein